jgi:hypothetical protein
MSTIPRAAEKQCLWVESEARRMLGAFGQHARVYNVCSAGDSGEGCEVIEFTTPTSEGPVPWTARVTTEDGRPITICTVGW